MANNSFKRDIANRALMILNAGKTGSSGVLFSTIDDTEFADWTTVSETEDPDKRLMCFNYDRILKQVILDIKPKFARAAADLGYPVKVNKADFGWSYLFELPADFLPDGLIRQCSEGNVQEEGTDLEGVNCDILFFKEYSHVVLGTDDQAYYCNTNHTSVDDATDGQPTDNDGDTNWTLYDEDGSLGATWYEGVAYKYSATGFLLASNALTNEDGDGAYIEYLAYVQTASGGTAGRSDQPAYYPESFKNAFATRLAAEMCIDSKDYERRTQLLMEYERLAKPAVWSAQGSHKDRVRKPTIFESRTRF